MSSGAPPELFVVSAVLGVAGGLIFWPVLQSLPGTFRLLGDGAFGRDFGLLLLLVWIIFGSFGAACIVLAWRILQADRVARGLSYVLAGGLGLAILIGDVKDAQLDIIMIACFGVVAVLAAAPRVQQFFTGPSARQYDHPTSVVVARTLVAVWSYLTLLVGLIYLPLGDLGSKYVVIGLFLIALGAGGFALNRRLRAGEPTARVIATAGAAFYVVLLLILGSRDPSVLLPLMLAAGVIAFLWLPADAKAFFSEPTASVPLPWDRPKHDVVPEPRPESGPAAPAVAASDISRAAPQPAPVTQTAPTQTMPRQNAPTLKACEQPACGRVGHPTTANDCPGCGASTVPVSASS
jgi:hypothetical protein